MKKKLVFIAFVCLLAGSPALADLFNFTVSSAQTAFDGTSAFSTTLNNLSSVNVTRTEAPTGWATLSPGTGGFSLNMTISAINNITQTAVGTGTFTLTDLVGQQLTGDLSGVWTRVSTPNWNAFSGTLSNVSFTPPGGVFIGNIGPGASMNFTTPPPWNGSVVELTAAAPWFGTGTAFNVGGGGVYATIVPVPVAALLGLLGLGTAGLKLRKFV